MRGAVTLLSEHIFIVWCLGPGTLPLIQSNKQKSCRVARGTEAAKHWPMQQVYIAPPLQQYTSWILASALD
jgi:hypothetical protein